MKQKSFITLITTLILAATVSMTAYAYGWGSDANGSFYYSDKDNTTKYTNGWYWVPFNDNGYAYSYYFDESGYILKDTTQDGFDLNSDGIWVISDIPQTSLISLPYDYFDIQTSVQGLSNSSLSGNYYQYFESNNKYSKDPIIVTVIDENTILIQGIYWSAPIEAKKETYNIYGYKDENSSHNENSDYFVFRDENTLELYSKLYGLAGLYGGESAVSLQGIFIRRN